MSDFWDGYEQKPYGKGNPYYYCVGCGRSNVHINGNLARHGSGCTEVEKRRATLAQEAVMALPEVKGLAERLAAAQTDAREAEAYSAELEATLAVASHNATAFGHKIVALEAKLAKVVEALEAGVICTTKHGGAAEFLRIARATLAELEASHAGKD